MREATRKKWLQYPEELQEAFRKDYQAMRDNMIYGNSLTYEKLLDRITELNGRINRIGYV